VFGLYGCQSRETPQAEKTNDGSQGQESYTDELAQYRKQAGLSNQRTGGGQRLQPVFCIVCQASIALCRSIRRRVIGSGGRGGT